MVHLVQRGETLFQIAKHYNVPVGTLIQANPGLSGSGLVIGQQLILPLQGPDLCKDGKLYQVQNETLIRLMEITGLSFAALLCANPDIDWNGPLSGKLICIPKVDRFKAPDPRDYYVVRTDDNVDTISRRLGITFYDLVQHNPSMTIMDFTKKGTPLGIPLSTE